MCDGCMGDCGSGDFGGACFPMSTLTNTCGMGDVQTFNDQGISSGDRFDMTIGGWYNSKGQKKERIAKKRGSESAYKPFKSSGSSTPGGYDMSERPLYVPVK